MSVEIDYKVERVEVQRRIVARLWEAGFKVEEGVYEYDRCNVSSGTTSHSFLVEMEYPKYGFRPHPKGVQVRYEAVSNVSSRWTWYNLRTKTLKGKTADNFDYAKIVREIGEALKHKAEVDERRRKQREEQAEAAEEAARNAKLAAEEWPDYAPFQERTRLSSGLYKVKLEATIPLKVAKDLIAVLAINNAAK